MQNLPKELYVEKLIELTSSNEKYIIDYRTSLCSKAKTFDNCPPGNLTIRKTTKNCSSIIKYANDCFALTMFCNGETPTILADVLDKCKNKPPEFPKTTIVQIRSTIQGLLERVTKLEDNQSKSGKTIQVLKKTIADLQTKNNSLQTENDQLRDRFNAHATSCETARKNTNSTIKRLEGLDYTEYQMNYEKSKIELSRLSRLCTSLQKQITDTKTKLKIIIPQSPSPLENNTQKADNTMSQMSDFTHEPLVYKPTCAQQSVNKTDDRPTSQDHLTVPNHANNHNRDGKSTSAKPEDTHINSKQNDNPTVTETIMVKSQKQSDRDDMRRDQPQKAVACRGTSTEPEKSLFRPMIPGNDHSRTEQVIYPNTTKSSRTKYRGEARTEARSNNEGVVRRHDIGDHRGDESEPDIFEGVTYKRKARYYIAGISSRSTRTGLMNYVSKKGVKITHFVLFKPRYPGARLTAKINVSPKDSELLESGDFWPEGVSCRKWLGQRAWKEKIDSENHKKDDDEREDNDEQELDDEHDNEDEDC